MKIRKSLPVVLFLFTGLLAKAQTLPTVPIYTYSVPSGGYAPNGNLSNYTDSVTGTWGMQYDNLNRVYNATATAGNYNGLTMQWQYDSFGNRLSQDLSGSGVSLPTSTSARYDDGTNRITSSSFGVDTSSYDVAGNLKFDGLNHIAYDAENRVCAVLNSVGTLTQYLYNAEGQRVAKGHSASGNTLGCPVYGDFVADEKYILGQSGEQVTQVDGQGQWQHTNVYANGQLLATYDREGSQQLLHFNVTDPLGTKRIQASASGAPEQNCMSLPYGDGLNCNGTGQDATEHHFTGKERDQESGLDYFGARYYASTMGRWMSPDWSAKAEPVPYAKLDNPQSLNLYGYVGNNPLSRVDADGHCWSWAQTICNAAQSAFGTATQLLNDGLQRTAYAKAASTLSGPTASAERKALQATTYSKLSPVGKAITDAAKEARVGQLANKTAEQLAESASRTNSAMNAVGTGSTVLGTIGVAAGVGSVVVDTVSAPAGQKLDAASDSSARLGGSALGAEVGGTAGALVGGPVGAFVGSVLGGVSGNKVVNAIQNAPPMDPQTRLELQALP